MSTPFSPPSRSSYGSDSSSSTTASSTSDSSSSTASSISDFRLDTIHWKKILNSYFTRYDKERTSEIDVLLKRNKGKEAKLMLMLAKRYETSNPLNAVYIKYHRHLNDEQLEDFATLATLFISVFWPSDLNEVDTLLEKHKGKEEDLFSKLASNFRAINPLKIRKIEQSIDYKRALVAFFEEHDSTKVEDVDATLKKCVGKEAILFSVLAERYQTMNGLDPVLRCRLGDCINDYVSLLQLYLAIFHPACTSDAESMLSRWIGREPELFSRLAQKFRSTNPLSICVVRRTGMTTLKQSHVSAQL